MRPLRLLSFVVLITSAIACAQTAPAAPPHRVAIRAGRLIDGKNDQPI
jgi:hypothetical protein